MGNIRYLAQTMTETQPEGIRRTISSPYVTAYSYVKAEETAFDPKTRQSTLRISLVTRADFEWYSAEYLDLGGFGVSVNGTAVQFTPLAKGDGKRGSYEEIAYGTVTLPARRASETDCTLTVYAPDTAKAYDGAAAWNARIGAMPAAKIGSYSFPLTKVEDGSKVYIGGEAYAVYIGNGNGLDRYDVYIGGEKY